MTTPNGMDLDGEVTLWATLRGVTLAFIHASGKAG
jgi:hypothetical protein